MLDFRMGRREPDYRSWQGDDHDHKPEQYRNGKRRFCRHTGEAECYDHRSFTDSPAGDGHRQQHEQNHRRNERKAIDDANRYRKGLRQQVN